MYTAPNNSQGYLKMHDIINQQNVSKKWAKNFCSISAEIHFLLCNVGMGNKLYETKIFDLCVKN